MLEDEAPGALLFAGDAFCDLVFTGTGTPRVGEEVYAERFLIAPGGEAIHAVAAARLGARSYLSSSMGDDALGSHVLTLLAAESGLNLSGVSLRTGYQTPVSVSFSGPDDRGFITYVAPHDFTVTPPAERVAALHVGLMHSEDTRIVELRGLGAIVVGSVGWDATGTWSREALDRLASIDVFIPNAVEAMSYTHTSDPLQAARALAQRGPLAIVTCGEDGIVAVDPSTRRELILPAMSVEAVDPTGAGDVFTAAFMVSLTEDWSLPRRLEFAVAAAAYSVTGIGGAPSAPTSAQLDQFIGRPAAGPE